MNVGLDSAGKPWAGEPVVRDAQLYLAKNDFPSFIRAVAPWYILEYVHIAVARHLEAVLHGEIDRLMIEMAPRGGKSTMASQLFPAFYLGHHPADKVMAGSHNFDLAKEFGGEVRLLLQSESYQSIFPGIQLVPYKRGAARWSITSPYGRNGTYWAFGIGSGIAGRGFNLGLMDDTLSEQTKDSLSQKEKIKRWYPAGFYTRRQPERNAIIFIGTRWAWDDLQGDLLEKSAHDPDADKWVKLSIPALLDHRSAVLIQGIGATDDTVKATATVPEPYIAPDKDRGEAEPLTGTFSPARFPMKELLRSRNNMPEREWNAQYMQRPSSEEGAIMKRKYWRPWGAKRDMPEPLMVVACLDTAFEEKQDNDNSAFTVWNIFEEQDIGRDAREYQHHHMMLVGAWAQQVDAVDLLATMHELLIKPFKPDLILIEKRASGIQLIQEMRKQRLPVRPWLPPGPQGSKGKRPRAFAAQVVMQQGGVWYLSHDPKTKQELHWPNLVIEECARVPYDTTHDDIADTVTMATIYLRRHWWLGLPMDELTDEEENEATRKAALQKRRTLYGGGKHDPVQDVAVGNVVKFKRTLYG
jgi:hypothetical protein